MEVHNFAVMPYKHFFGILYLVHSPGQYLTHTHIYVYTYIYIYIYFQNVISIITVPYIVNCTQDTLIQPMGNKVNIYLMVCTFVYFLYKSIF